jgi:Ala-tRNA(Pro) deacylase
MQEDVMTTDILKDFLDRQHVKYQTIPHTRTYTAQQTAQSAHIPARHFAKTVMVWIDGKLAMAVLPASQKLDLELLKQGANAQEARLALESEFEMRFPGCEAGAMPPFGNLYGLEVFIEKALVADGRIAFNSGSHTELMSMTYRDFDRLVRPRVVNLTHGTEQPGRPARPVHPEGRMVKLTPAAVAILDVFALGGQPACSQAELCRLIERPEHEIEAGIEELERLDLLRTEFQTPEESGYELTAAGKNYVSTCLHTSAL